MVIPAKGEESNKLIIFNHALPMGGNSQYEAIYRRPDLFANDLCMRSPLVPSMSAIFLAFSRDQTMRNELKIPHV
jgi:hypothetical protein